MDPALCRFLLAVSCPLSRGTESAKVPAQTLAKMSAQMSE